MPSKTRGDLLLLIVDGAFQTKVWHRADDQGRHRQAAYRAGPLLKGWNCLHAAIHAEWKAATRAAANVPPIYSESCMSGRLAIRRRYLVANGHAKSKRLRNGKS